MTAAAITSNDDIDEVKFVWRDPTDTIQRNVTIPTITVGDSTVAMNTYNPNIPGVWTIEAHFEDGTSNNNIGCIIYGIE